jgi:putative transposase
MSPRFWTSEAHRAEFSIRSMCRVLMVHFSGFYAWFKEPLGARALEDARQTNPMQQAWGDSGKVYEYHKLHDDLLDQCETCSGNRVARLASLSGHRSANRLQRQQLLRRSAVASSSPMAEILLLGWGWHCSTDQAEERNTWATS